MGKVDKSLNLGIAGNNTDKVYKLYLLEDESVRYLCQSRINMAIQAYTTSDGIEDELENLQKIVQQAVNEAVGKKNQFRRRKGLKI